MPTRSVPLLPALVAAGLLHAACAPAHLRTVGVSGSRELPELFLGGWDGRRLGAFDDSYLEPGVTPRAQLVDTVGRLSSSVYGAVWIEKAKLDPAFAAKHGLFCEASTCLAVLDRTDRGGGVDEWGLAVAVFELTGPEDGLVGPIWLAGRMVRPPGPMRWPLLCRGRDDRPRRVHPDGGALYPERVVGGESFALFGPTLTPALYLSKGTAAPAETVCDDEAARLLAEPPPELPVIRADPGLLGNGP